MTRRFWTASLLLLSGAGLLPVVGHAQTFTVEKFNVGAEGTFDYLMADGTGRVYLSRSTHMMIIEGNTGKVLGDITGLKGVHGIAVSAKDGHGFITGSGDSVVTMFDLKTFAVLKPIMTHTGGLDGIMYDDFSDRIILTNHSRPGTATAIDAKTGDIVGVATLEDNAPEGAASDGKGRIFVNNEGTSTIQVIDVMTMKVQASWPIAPCDGPTGIAYDRASDRIFSGCSGTSVVINATTGKVVATLKNGNGVDALGFDPSTKLIYIPSSAGMGSVSVYHEDTPDTYTLVATVAPTMTGARTIAVDTTSHNAYVFSPEYGPAPAVAPGATPPAGGRGGGRAPRPIVAAWLVVIRKG